MCFTDIKVISNLLHYHPERSWGKVIFSEACVKNSVHRGGVWADTPLGRHPPGSSACWEIWATSGRYASYWNAYLLFLPAATKLGQGNIFTSICPQSGEGCLPQCMLGYPPPRSGTPPPPPPPDQAQPPGPGTSPPPEQTPPPGADTHPPQEQTPLPPEADCSIRLTSGRDASYWNAFLLLLLFLCFRCKDSVKHFNVTWLGESEGYKFGMNVYPTLKEFIDHFDNQPLIAGESGS